MPLSKQCNHTREPELMDVTGGPTNDLLACYIKGSPDDTISSLHVSRTRIVSMYGVVCQANTAPFPAFQVKPSNSPNSHATMPLISTPYR